ncbi:alkaline phosphatase 4 [Harpegnathos saltator]|uniref:alkaline phosphatase 4 n=1 Tax=Harpegnathos saltator TaxID=610380 RepID=UPI00058B937A|nr:alkaline phosphatase 4 [Harpegnathos saltator]XP_011142773.1 alkaline phosphatase 4 [Harpegnathos saltator]XP_025160751.1 alkaline phosphatase 4 [Harpegnathos saltator]
MKRCILLFCVLAVPRDSEALPQESTDYEDMSFWLKSGQETLHKILNHRNNENRAKNVIIFIGDGMGLSSITSGRIYKGQLKGQAGEEYQLAFEKFPNTGLAKTYNVDMQVPDSAGTATAIFSGVKCRYNVIGLDARAQKKKCDKKINEASKLTTIADWAQQSGKDTGFVTTTRVTHATPAGLYAHTNSRDWECDSKMTKSQRDCVKDIARQLIEDEPGSHFKVIMGGGGQYLGMPLESNETDTCKRDDGRNLVEEWQAAHPQGKFVNNTQDLMSVDISKTSHILGIFSPSHMPYHAVKSSETPSLSNMTLQAIRMLKKNKNGFVLMVESGKIDLAHHANFAKLAMRELSELEEAVLVALQQVKVEETLIIVTADHSHSFSLNGYPKRGNDILGFANKPDEPNTKPYETLAYINGPGFFYHRRNNSNNVNETWRQVEQDETRGEPFYRNFAGIYLKDETHGGEDVGVYAIGPYAHLFRGTFEQNYIAHAIAYAACFKDWPSHCDDAYHRYFYAINMPEQSIKWSNSARQNIVSFTTTIALLLSMIFLRFC